MQVCVTKSEAENQDSADDDARPQFCPDCGGRLIPAGYAYASKEGFWLEQKCIRCDAESVATFGLTCSPF